MGGVVKAKMDRRYRATMLVDVYEMARAGLGKPQIAEGLTVDVRVFNRWLRERKAFRTAFARGREAGGRDSMTREEVPRSFRSFMYGRLPKKLCRLWRKFQACEEAPSPTGKLEALTAEAGQRGMMHLFLYAPVHYQFNMTRACRAIGVPRKRVNKWLIRDPEFGEMIDEMTQARKDLYEEALTDLVIARNPAAVLFANKSLNQDRGYNPSKKVEIDSTKTITHKHENVSVDELDLTLRQKQKLLQAYRSRKAELDNE